MATRRASEVIVWRAPISAFVLLNILDLATTWIALSAGMREANPIPSTLLILAGPGSLILLKLAVVLAVALIMGVFAPAYPSLWRGLKFANALLAIIVVSNTVQLLS